LSADHDCLYSILAATLRIWALGPTQTAIQRVPGALSLGVKRLGREVDHLPPSSAEVKQWVELYLHSPNTPSWRGAQLKKKHRDHFTLPFASRGRIPHQHTPCRGDRALHNTAG
jgi:hypothetical protein